MNLLDIFKKKKPADFTRVELEKIATENNVPFTKDTSDAELTEVLEFAIAKLKEEKTSSGKKLKVRILLPVAGKYGLTCDVDKEYELEEKQALEIIEDKYAELVK